MDDVNRGSLVIKPEDIIDITRHFDSLVSNVESLDKKRLEARGRLNIRWAGRYHPSWRGWIIVRGIMEKTRKVVGGKAEARSSLLIKELKASKKDVIRVDKPLWEAIERGIGLDERGLIIDEDILMTLEELKRQIAAGKAEEVFNSLFSSETKEKFQRLQMAGEGLLVEDVKKFMSRATTTRNLFERRRTVLGRYYNLIKNIRLDASSLTYLIKVIKSMVASLQKINPDDKLLNVIRKNRILLHLLMYDNELDYLKNLLSKVGKSPKEFKWEDFFGFYDQGNHLRRFNEHVRKIRDEFGDFNTAGALEKAGKNVEAYGDEPLKWISLLEFLDNRLKSREYTNALVNVGGKSLIQAIEEEMRRLQEVVTHMLNKELAKIEGKIQSRISRLEDMRPVVKSILKQREKTLIRFLKTTRKEFGIKEDVVSRVFEDNKDFLAALPQINIYRHYDAIKKSSQHKIASIPKFVENLKGVRQSVAGIMQNPKNPYNFSPILLVMRALHYLTHLEVFERVHEERLKMIVCRNMPLSLRKSLLAMAQINTLLENSLDYLKSQGFVKKGEYPQVGTGVKKDSIVRNAAVNENALVGGEI